MASWRIGTLEKKAWTTLVQNIGGSSRHVRQKLLENRTRLLQPRLSDKHNARHTRKGGKARDSRRSAVNEGLQRHTAGDPLLLGLPHEPHDQLQRQRQKRAP